MYKKWALKIFQKTIKIKPNFAEAYNSLGMLFSDLKKSEEAMLNYKKAIRLKTNYEIIQ